MLDFVRRSLGAQSGEEAQQIKEKLKKTISN